MMQIFQVPIVNQKRYKSTFKAKIKVNNINVQHLTVNGERVEYDSNIIYTIDFGRTHHGRFAQWYSTVVLKMGEFQAYLDETDPSISRQEIQAMRTDCVKALEYVQSFLSRTRNTDAKNEALSLKSELDGSLGLFNRLLATYV